MVEDALIRLENLRALGHTPRELILRVGNSYAYWHDLLAGRKSFGETIINLDELRELPLIAVRIKYPLFLQAGVREGFLTLPKPP